MVFFNSFCANCQRIFPKKQLNCYDGTCRGECSGDKSWLCRECFLLRATANFENYQGKVVAVEPMPRYAYQSYTFHQMELWQYQAESIAFIQDLIAHLDKCEGCGATARFLLCDPSIFGKDPTSGNWDTDLHFNRQALCGRCFAKVFAGKVRELDLRFVEFFPPPEGEGLYTPMEA